MTTEAVPIKVADLAPGDIVLIYGDVTVEVLGIERLATGIRLTWRQFYADGSCLDGRYLLGEDRVLPKVVQPCACDPGDGCVTCPRENECYEAWLNRQNDLRSEPASPFLAGEGVAGRCLPAQSEVGCTPPKHPVGSDRSDIGDSTATNPARLVAAERADATAQIGV